MRTTLIALMTLLALAAGAASATASGRDVIGDCSDDEVLSKRYTQKEYRDALRQIPGDFDQYGNCRDIIARAQDAAATKGGSKQGGSKQGDSAGGGTPGGGTSGGGTPGGGTSGGGTPGGQAAAGSSVQPAKDQLAAASAEDQAAAREAARSPVDAGIGAGGPISAQSAGTEAGTGLSELPLPVLLLLALLLTGALALGATRIRSLVHTRGA